MKNIFSDKKNKELLTKILHEISCIRDKSTIIAFTPDNTGYSWLGVKNGTMALFPENVICLPQNYSNSVFSKKNILRISKFIANLKFDKIIFRGFPLYFEILIRR